MLGPAKFRSWKSVIDCATEDVARAREVAMNAKVFILVE
jgi:hypothetical protein